MKNPISHIRTEPHPDKPGAQDVEAMNGRCEALEVLYELDGRHRSDHPFHMPYTGLWAKPPF